MANYFDRIPLANGWYGARATHAATKTGLALDSNYAYGVSGDAIACRFVAGTTSNLVTVYAFMTAHGGTPADLTCELRNYSAANLPGNTLHDSATADPGTTDNKWVTFDMSASPYQCVAGVTYFIVIGRAAADGTDYATMCYQGAPQDKESDPLFHSFRTTDGFATVKTDCYCPACMVLEFADGTLQGQPYTTSVAAASNTLERGLKISGLTEKVSISGVVFLLHASLSGLKIYSGTTAPAGATERTETFGGGEGACGAARFAPFTLNKDTVYRIVFTSSGNNQSPSYYSNEDGAAVADTVSCQFGGGTFCYTVDDGAGGWTDTTTAMPRMNLIVNDQVAVEGG